MNETAVALQLLEDLKPELTSFCYRMLGSIEDADDAVQETSIRVWQSWNSFRQESSYKTWVYRIATKQLCFIALLQALPPRQRAVLILKDVFEWSSKQISETLGMSPAAVNSALQRARETMDRTKLRSGDLSRMDAEPDRELLSRYVDAFEKFDIDALVALFHEEGCMSMPPFPMWIHGKDDLFKFFLLTRWHCEGSRFQPVTVNE